MKSDGVCNFVISVKRLFQEREWLNILKHAPKGKKLLKIKKAKLKTFKYLLGIIRQNSSAMSAESQLPKYAENAYFMIKSFSVIPVQKIINAGRICFYLW